MSKIVVKNKEYQSGKMVRSKYKIYGDVRNKLTEKEKNKEPYSEEDLDAMVNVLVKVYDNQFTEEDINDDMDIADIIFNFSSIDFDIGIKLDNKVEKVKRAFMKGKK